MSVTFPQGFTAAGVRAGISSVPNKQDLAFIVNTGDLDVAAGVFTANRFCAAPVQWSRQAVADGHLKAVVLNSGGANACTGQRGYEQTQATAQTAAHLLNVSAHDIAVCSTGLIGELLPMENVLQGVEHAYHALAHTRQAGTDAAYAIMTTDTMPKTVALSGSGFRVGGMVKGSGMIAPQLATMLCVLTTDAVITSDVAAQALQQAVEYSFNRIDVDGCMSTNDTVLLLASGASGVIPRSDEFTDMLQRACSDLAQAIVGDGEGASHQIAISVRGASDEPAALACARAIAASNLLKCAIFGNDPNWGRVLSSLGTVPADTAPFNPDKVSVSINGVCIYAGSEGTAHDRSDVNMNQRVIRIEVDLQYGQAQATVWTDDLTHEYVRINAEYES